MEQETCHSQQASADLGQAAVSTELAPDDNKDASIKCFSTDIGVSSNGWTVGVVVDRGQYGIIAGISDVIDWNLTATYGTDEPADTCEVGRPRNDRCCKQVHTIVGIDMATQFKQLRGSRNPPLRHRHGLAFAWLEDFSLELPPVTLCSGRTRTEGTSRIEERSMNIPVSSRLASCNTN